MVFLHEAYNFTIYNQKREERVMKKVLVVEDDEANRNLLVAILTGEGHEVVCAEDGGAGWRMFNEQRGNIRMVFSDIEMEPMDGLYLLENIRRTDQSIPFYFCTGKAPDDLPREAIMHMVTDIFYKPYNLSQITNAAEQPLPVAA